MKQMQEVWKKNQADPWYCFSHTLRGCICRCWHFMHPTTAVKHRSL